ncbi:MAG: ferrous iron transport protein A [Desulfococcaceae bacterium]
MFWKRRNGRGKNALTRGLAIPSLTQLKSGERAEVCGISAGAKARVRLASLGLIPGSRLQVVANSGVGPLLLSVGESRLMVERGVAEKVEVRKP